MGNISTTNTNAIYKYTCTILTAFKNDKDPLTINNMRVRTLTIDYNYDAHIFPLIYATLALNQDMVDKLKENQAEGTVLFTLQKYIENSDMPGLKINVINEECVYFISNDVGKNNEKAVNDDRTADYGYVVTVGFIAKKHINQNKIQTNGIIKSGSMSATLIYLLNKQNVLMEPLTYNPQVKYMIIPPSGSLFKTIKYLNKLNTFYDTPFRFFMDFDTTYLISSSGKGIAKKGDQNNTVKINIRSSYAEKNMEGMTEDKDNHMYIIDVSASNSKIANSEFVDRVATSISGTSTTGNNEKLNITNNIKNNPIKENTNPIRIPNGNTNMLKNMQSQTLDNATLLSIHKSKIDGSIFSLNKYYLVDASEAYGKDYNGIYLLTSKVEVFAQEGQGLTMSTMLTFKKKNQLEE